MLDIPLCLLICVGELLYAIGGVGLTLVTSLIVADLSPLEWRGFITALPDMPYIINAYVSYVFYSVTIRPYRS